MDQFSIYGSTYILFLPNELVIFQSTCSSQPGNLFGWLFKSFSARQFPPEIFQATGVRVLFSTKKEGLAGESTNSLGKFVMN